MPTVTVLAGEGIGREVVAQATRVVNATGINILWDYRLIGEDAVNIYGNPLPNETLDSIKRNKIALKGPTGTPPGSLDKSYNVRLREIFDLYANVRPVRNMPGVKTRFSDTPIDIVTFRENIEDLYVAEEYKIDGGAEAIARITEMGSERIARFAFEYATKHNRKKITIVHKANVVKRIYGLFRETAKNVAKEYPNIICNDLIVDNTTMQLVTRPEQFDCILAPNLFGDILSDLCAGLVGGLGFAPGANIGKDCAIFEAVHGTAPDIAGKGIANPTSIILSAAMMLDYINEAKAAKMIRTAVDTVLREGMFVTGDVNREHSVSTSDYANALIRHILASNS